MPIPNLIAGVALINSGFPVGFAAAMGAIASAPALLFSASLVLSDILIMKGKITPQTAHTITSLTLLVATVASVAVLLLLVPEVAATIMSLALLGVTLLGLYYSYTKYSTLQDRSAIDVLTGRNGPVNYI